jgi:hypothetical protein
MRADDAVDAPADAVKWVVDLARTRQREPSASPIRRLLAVLKADLGMGERVFGERSASGAAARQLLFEADDIAIDIRISPADDGFTIRGQLICEDVGDASVFLNTADGQTSRSCVDEFGEFRFDGLSAGEYELNIQNVGEEIVIPQIRIS